MILHSYFCTKCMEPHDFPNEDNRTIFLCPTCKSRMEYWCSAELNNETGLVIKTWVDEEKQRLHPKIKISKPTSPTITCPYCKSNNCKKISSLSKAGSVALWGIFGLGKTTKQWHCNKCGSDF